MSSEGNYTDRRVKLQDKIPEAQWSDARKEYYCDGKTLEEIATDHYIDKRIISQLIRQNKPFSDIGVRRNPTVIQGFEDIIEGILRSGVFHHRSGITTVSRKLYEELLLQGYSGGERSLRNYIQNVEWQKWIAQGAKSIELEQQ